MNELVPVVGITMGDPAGIGPEIILKALRDPGGKRGYIPLVFGDPHVMEKARGLLDDPPSVVATNEVLGDVKGGGVLVVPSTEEDLSSITWGRLDERAGRAQYDFICRAVSMALEGNIDAVVTSPINKQGLKLAGVPFPGHTEMLAHMTGSNRVAMMLVGPKLRVVPATLHLPLSVAIKTLSVELIHQTVITVHKGLCELFSIAVPRIGVCGLNPHAGDGGIFGREESDLISPAIELCREQGICVEGPLPPDSAFSMAMEGRYDAVVAMYHDQGLIPVKLIHRGEAVNLTLGIPIIRTSVDHGTAYDIAGKGVAREESLIAALELAAELARKRVRSGASNPKA
jgi:4-hydroxythreonine-4-phosphate dehydrogenase